MLKEKKISSDFGGFNYIGIVMPCGNGQELIIKGVEENSAKAWMVTGIEY